MNGIIQEEAPTETTVSKAVEPTGEAALPEWKRYLTSNWNSYICGREEGHPIVEEDLKKLGIWDRREDLRAEFHRADEREDCALIQAGAFVVNGWAYLILGMSTIDIIETMSQFDEVDGVIGTGNSLFVSRDCRTVYTTLSEPDTRRRYEVHHTGNVLKYLYEGKVAPLIILNRTFRDKDEYLAVKRKKESKVIVDIGSNFYVDPIRYSGNLKTRLRWKFVKTARTGHCVTNPTLTEKELLFDEQEPLVEVINNFKGSFVLGYMLWSDKFANSVGMISNYSLDLRDNPSEIIGFGLVKLVNEFRKKNPELYGDLKPVTSVPLPSAATNG